MTLCATNCTLLVNKDMKNRSSLFKVKMILQAITRASIKGDYKGLLSMSVYLLLISFGKPCGFWLRIKQGNQLPFM